MNDDHDNALDDAAMRDRYLSPAAWSPDAISYDEGSDWCQHHGHTGLLLTSPGVVGCQWCDWLYESRPEFARLVGTVHNPDGSPHGLPPDYNRRRRQTVAHMLTAFGFALFCVGLGLFVASQHGRALAGAAIFIVGGAMTFAARYVE